jgi:hypothetical protein
MKILGYISKSNIGELDSIITSLPNEFRATENDKIWNKFIHKKL